MVLKKKYVFETKKTKLYRHFLSGVLIGAALFLCYSFFCILLLLDARNENKSSKSAFIENAPDLIVVFTGAPGRIQFAVEKAHEFKQPNVFITGVHQKNSVQSIIDPLKKNLEEKMPPLASTTDHIELDSTARNTVENVLSTLNYLRNNRGLQKILIVSSDYHIMRIKMIFNKLTNENDRFDFYFTSLKTNYFDLNHFDFSFKNVRLLYVETFKLLRTFIFLIYWDQKLPIPI